MTKKISGLNTIPVLFGFLIMGFVDVVGISTNYIKEDFGLSDTMANLLPMMVFLWFLILSVPTGLLMNKIGRKNTVLISYILTFSSMLIPFFINNFTVILIGFSLLGIGNTILQVSLNPLVSNVVRGEKLTSRLTLGQFIKAIASFSGPIIAAWASAKLGNWKIIFLIFAITTFISNLWLWLTPVKREKVADISNGISSCFSLLKDKNLLFLFLGILFVVGIDVGLNTSIPKILQEKNGLPLQQAGLGISLYFIARTVGTFMGSILLSRINTGKFFTLNMVMALAAIMVLFFVNSLLHIQIIIIILGFTIANVFPIIFSSAIKYKPAVSNEISGLMIMGVSGGAFITFLAGIASDLLKSQNGGLLILTVSVVYLLVLSILNNKINAVHKETS